MNTEANKQVMAQNIQRYMDQRGISRQQLCDALDIKYTTLRDWLKGITYPRIGKVEAMANYFGCEKSDLIEDKKEQPTEYDGLSEKKIAFIKKVMQMSDAELDRVDQILSLVENTK